MFNVVDTAFSYGRVLIICYFLQESSKVKASSLHEIQNADTAFLLGEVVVLFLQNNYPSCVGLAVWLSQVQLQHSYICIE